MASTLYIDESGREHVDPDFVVGGALVANRRALAARLHRIPFAWPFLDRPLHRAHLRSPGHLARRWSTWASLREVRDPSQDLGLFGGTPAERAGEMWRHGWFEEHLLFQTWLAGSDADTAHPSLVPAAFFRTVLNAGAPPPDSTDLGVLQSWSRAVGLRGPVVRSFIGLVEDSVMDALTGRNHDERPGSDPVLRVAYTRDQPVGSTLGERDRYLRMLGATLQTGENHRASRARIQNHAILPTDRPEASDLVRLHDKHIKALGVSIPTERVSFWKHATPGDEAADLLLGAVRRGGHAAVHPLRVLENPVDAANGGEE